MTGLENLIYTARLNGIPDKEAREKAMELMKRTGLEDQLKKKAGKYSRGMRQRLGLADVLIKNPEIIILDEPTSGIDPAGVQEFIELIRWLSKEKGLTVLFFPLITWIRYKKYAIGSDYLVMGKNTRTD